MTSKSTTVRSAVEFAGLHDEVLETGVDRGRVAARAGNRTTARGAAGRELLVREAARAEGMRARERDGLVEQAEADAALHRRLELAHELRELVVLLLDV